MEKIDPLTPLGRRVLNEIKERQNAGALHLDQDTIEAHVQRGEPIAPEKAKLIWLANQAVGEVGDGTFTGA